jgi:hypothetical protein
VTMKTQRDILKKVENVERRVDGLERKVDGVKARADQCFAKLAGTLDEPGICHQVSHLVESSRRVRSMLWGVIAIVLGAIVTDVAVRLLHG